MSGITPTAAAQGSIYSWENPETPEKEDPLGRNAFLTMMLAQLKHQDPLNPLDGTDFSAQLAQFSSLEQMFHMNDNLGSILTSLDAKSNDNIMDYIGKDVLSFDNSLDITEGRLTDKHYSIDQPAEIKITIYDANGLPVRNFYPGPTEAGTHQVEWDGFDDQGNLMDDGRYYFQISANNGSGQYIDIEAPLSGQVTGVTYENGRTYLLIDEIMVSPESILKIEQPKEI